MRSSQAGLPERADNLRTKAAAIAETASGVRVTGSSGTRGRATPLISLPF